MNKKIETWLPVFPGFYDTWFDSEGDYDMEIEHINQTRKENNLSELDADMIEFDNEGYEQAIAMDACSVMKDMLYGFVTRIIYQKVSSPPYYNFENDAVHIEIELSPENQKNILEFLAAHPDKFKQYIEEQYTSYDGFLSHYDPDPALFNNSTALDHKHKLGSILQFIWCMQAIEEYSYLPEEQAINHRKEDYFELVKQDNYIKAKNYFDVTEREYCHECQSFIDNYPYPNMTGGVCSDCREAGKKSGKYIVCCKCNTLIENSWQHRDWQHKIKHGFVTWDQVECNECSLITV